MISFLNLASSHRIFTFSFCFFVICVLLRWSSPIQIQFQLLQLAWDFKFIDFSFVCFFCFSLNVAGHYSPWKTAKQVTLPVTRFAFHVFYCQSLDSHFCSRPRRVLSVLTCLFYTRTPSFLPLPPSSVATSSPSSPTNTSWWLTRSLCRAFITPWLPLSLY